MLIYLILPLSVIYCLFLSRLTIIRNTNLVNDEVFYYRNKIILSLYFVLFFILAVFKGITVGTDSSMYYSFFLSKSYSIVEPGVGFFYDLAVRFDQFLIFQIGCYTIMLFFIYYGIKKYSPNYLISILLFLLMHIYYTGYNQLRQMIAASIVFCFVNYLLSDKKTDKFKFIFIILLALLFHNSAIFLFLLFLIPKKVFSSKVVIPLFLITIVLYFIPSFKNVVGDILSSVSGFYGEKYQQKLDFFFAVNKEKGLLQLIPVIIQMIFVTISLYFPKEKLKLNINDRLYQFSTNIVIINLCLYSLSGVEAIDRLQVYFLCFYIYYFSIVIHRLLNCRKRLHGQILVISIIAYWILYYMLRLFTNVHGIVPYRFFDS